MALSHICFFNPSCCKKEKSVNCTFCFQFSPNLTMEHELLCFADQYTHVPFFKQKLHHDQQYFEVLLLQQYLYKHVHICLDEVGVVGCCCHFHIVVSFSVSVSVVRWSVSLSLQLLFPSSSAK